MEPVSKKTGTFYRNERARKIELEKAVVSKMKPLENLFALNKKFGEVNQQQSSLVLNDTEKTNSTSNQSDEITKEIKEVVSDNNNHVLKDNVHKDFNGNSIEVESVRQKECFEESSQSPIANEKLVEQNVDGALGIDEPTLDPTDDYHTLGRIDDDPTKWPVNDPNFIQHFLSNKADQCVNELDLSTSKNSLSLKLKAEQILQQEFFLQKKINGEIIQRTWIYYSHSLGKIFCIYCKMFASKYSGSFVCDGFNDWKHPKMIEEHENTKTHRSSAYEFASRLREVSSVTSALEKQILDDRKYWIEILKRIVSVIKFLSARGLPLRGNNEHIGSSGNGNYLGILELLAEHDPLLREHVKKYGNKGKGSVSYLSSTIADEILTILAKELRDTIIMAILICKYFSLIVDSTPDVAHIDQLTICIRYVDGKGSAVERFLIFLPNTGHKGKEMIRAILDFLKSSGLIIHDCRGQSYDNAKNMSGIYLGLQAQIKEICPLAEYVPCSPHSLNLTLEHAAEGNADVARFFLFVQNIYVFFAASTKRWAILSCHLKNDLTEKQKRNPQERLLVPKKLSDTRWSARYDACRALKSGYRSFVAALKEIFQDPEEKKITQIEAEGLYKGFFKLETAILLEFWTAILLRANVTSKSLQNPWIDISTSTSLYKSLSTYITSLRTEESFNIFVEQAKTLVMGCSDWEEHNPQLNFNCYEKRASKRNSRCDMGKSFETIFSDYERIRISIFYSSLDSMASDLDTQVKAYETVLMPFSFMFELTDITDKKMREGAAALQTKYANDLDDEFANECIHFKFFMADINKAIENDRKCADETSPEDLTMQEASEGKSKLISKPSRMLRYIKSNKLEATFPNLEVALRIFESIAVANATGERSFSGMKRVKSPLRSVLGEKKLNDLALLFINNDITKEIDDDVVIKKFMELKERKRS